MPTIINDLQSLRRTGDGLFIVESDLGLFDRTYNERYYRARYDNTNRQFGDSRGDIIQETSLYLSDRLPLQTSQQEDYFRHMMGAFWTYSEEYGRKTLDVYRNRFPDSPFIRQINLLERRVSRNPISGVNVVSQDISFDFLDREAAQQIRQALYDFFINNRNAKFYDHATTFNIFEEGSNEKEEQYGILNLYANIDAEYNFLHKQYEVQSKESEEKYLPNFYGYTSDSYYRFPLTEGQGLLDPAQRLRSLSELFTDNNNESECEPTMFDPYACVDFETTTYMTIPPDTRGDIVFTKEELPNFDELYKQREMFPMYTTIEFTTESGSEFGTILEDTKFSSQIRDYINSSQASFRQIETSEVVFQKFITGERRNIDTGLASDGAIRSSNSVSLYASEGVRKYYDVEDFFDNYLDRMSEADGSYIYFNEEHNLNPIENRAFFNLMSIIVKGKLEKIKENLTRDFFDLIDGTQAHNEIIYYKIEKYNEENSLIQSFYFPNISQIDIIKFVDTQVKYDRKYKYKINSVNLIIGTKYSYIVNEEFHPMTPFTTTDGLLTVSTEPSVKMVEVPLFEKIVTIMDKPPVAPDVELIPFRGINNKIRMFLNSGTGKYMATPIIFSEEERQMIDRQRIAQSIPANQEQIMFETDDEIVEFHIYRIEEEPYKYIDFENSGEKIIVKTNQSSSGAYDDKIIPNKKYYYCVRSVDYHGNISYPSLVYEFEMVDDAGSIYPSWKIHEFRSISEKTPTAGVKRFISISPSMNNLFIDEEGMGIVEGNGPSLGRQVILGTPSRPSSWGKKFKIRLTSKNTGRKLDFNFTFKHNNEIW